MRTRIRFRDEDGNILNLREYGEPSGMGTFFIISAALGSLWLIFKLLERLFEFLQALSMF